MIRKKKGETSYKQTAFGIIPRSKLIPLEIEGTKRVWDFVMDKSKKGNINITPALIKQIHKIGFKWIFPEFGGKFRVIEVMVSKHVPPKHYLIGQLILNLTNDIKTRIKYLPQVNNTEFIDKLIELLAWAHHRFLWIHPFQDYNGRISRILNNIVLLNLNMPPIELKVETKSGRKKYVHALQKADKGEYAELEKLIRLGIEESIEEIK